MRSLRVRLSALVGLATLVLVSVSVWYVVREAWQRNELRLDDRLVLEADRVVVESRRSFERTGSLVLSGVPRDHIAMAVDVDGNVLASVGPYTDEELSEAALQFGIPSLRIEDSPFIPIDFEGGRFSVVMVRCDREELCWALGLGRPETTLRTYIVRRAPWLAAVVVAAAALAGLAARIVVGRSLRPVDRMRRELDEITANDLGRRVQVPATGDEIQALGESFNRTIDRLASGVESQQRFSSDAAHELRSPLAALRATLEVALREPSAAREAIVTALHQTDRAADVVDDLLVLARRGTSAPPIAPRVTDVDDLVHREVRDLSLRRPDLGVDRSQVHPVQASVRPEEITRVVRNLVDNAAVHASSSVTVSLRSDGIAWELAVDDDGPGVPDEQRAVIFERFRRLDGARSRDTGGAGLGLAIVADLVRGHDGTIEVTDSRLGGASFRIRVPHRQGG